MAKKHGVDGNKNRETFKTPEARQGAFKLFCEHIAAGYSTRSFHTPCVENTILKMIRDYPHEFDVIELDRAKARGCHEWESIGKKGTTGKLQGFNSSSWWRIMQNKLGWKDNVQLGGDKENPLAVTGTGPLSAAEQAVLDHFKEKLLYESKHQGGITKGEKGKNKS